MAKLKLYLAGSIKLWQEDFQPRYTTQFNHKTHLFEPGTLDVPEQHIDIAPEVTERCRLEIENADAVLVYMKQYSPTHLGGAAGVDSSWECGYAYGLGKPTIALIDDVSHFQYFENQWMLSHHMSTFVASDQKTSAYIKKSSHFTNLHLIEVSTPSEIEQSIVNYLL